MISTRRRWVAVLALATFLVTGAIGALVVRLGGQTYRSTAVLSIDQPSVLLATAEPGPVLKLQTLRAQYAALLSTSVLLDPIAARVGRSASDIQDTLRAVADKNSLLVVITADGDDRGQTRALTEAASDALISYVTQTQDDAFIPRDKQVSLELLSPAGATSIITGGVRTTVTAGLFIGLVGAAAMAVIATWVRPVGLRAPVA